MDKSIEDSKRHWNLGKISHCSDREYGDVLFMARCMMNAKPDIVVVYSKEGDSKEYIKFIECKYQSYESSYKLEWDGKIIKYEQTKIQSLIAKYLIVVENKAFEEPYSRIVQFCEDEKEIKDTKDAKYRSIDSILPAKMKE